MTTFLNYIFPSYFWSENFLSSNSFFFVLYFLFQVFLETNHLINLTQKFKFENLLLFKINEILFMFYLLIKNYLRKLYPLKITKCYVYAQTADEVIPRTDWPPAARCDRTNCCSAGGHTTSSSPAHGSHTTQVQ